MSRHRDGPRIFEKVDIWRGDAKLVIPIYYQPKAYEEKDYFFAELDGKRVQAKLPSEVQALLEKLVEKSWTYSGWAFYLKVSSSGGIGRNGGREHGGRGLEVEHQLLLLGKRSDGKLVTASCHFGPDFAPHVGPFSGRGGPRKVEAWGYRRLEGPCCKAAISDPLKANVLEAKEFYSGLDREGIVPFTTERLRWLLRLEEAVGELRERIGKIMGGKGKRLERRLDAAVAVHRMPLALPPASKGRGS